jgi:hypothetical protein
MQVRIPLSLVALLLAVEAFSQQSAKPRPSFLLHGNPLITLGGTGAIHGVVIAHDGQPAKGITVTVVWLCPETCQFVMSNAMTNEAGEYRFDPVTFGNYDVFVGDVFDLVGSPSKFTATLNDRVELSPDQPEAEARFEVCEQCTPYNRPRGYAGKVTGVVVGQTRTVGCVSVRRDGSSYVEAYHEDFWERIDAPGRLEALDKFESDVQELMQRIRSFRDSNACAHAVFAEAVRRIETEDREELDKRLRAEYREKQERRLGIAPITGH